MVTPCRYSNHHLSRAGVAAGVQWEGNEVKAAAELAAVRAAASYTQQRTMRRSFDFLEYMGTSPEEGGYAETESMMTLGTRRFASVSSCAG
jgi:hypothetical protein